MQPERLHHWINTPERGNNERERRRILHRVNTYYFFAKIFAIHGSVMHIAFFLYQFFKIFYCSQ
jgi:hypothetical protein